MKSFCRTCHKKLLKGQYFCSNKCKDSYWNKTAKKIMSIQELKEAVIKLGKNAPKVKENINETVGQMSIDTVWQSLNGHRY